MNHDTIQARCESTPFMHVETPSGNVRLWWSKNSGTYGFQVYGFAYDSETGETRFYKTDGYGYCKESSALQVLFKHLGRKPRGMRLGGETVPNQYRLGGNYYKINKKDWLVAK